jgi:hypothetical protein
MRYAQIKGGLKLHLVFTADGRISLPLCGVKFNGNYRATFNVPLAHACKNCTRIYDANGGEKTRDAFFNSLRTAP